jgi:hypothetical protein
MDKNKLPSVKLDEEELQYQKFFKAFVFALIIIIPAVIIYLYLQVFQQPINQQRKADQQTNRELILKDFPDKQQLGENDTFIVYLVNEEKDPQPHVTGEIIVYNKNTKKIIEINGSFSLLGRIKIINNPKKKYLLLSTGFNPNRIIVPINLQEKQRAVENFCSISTFLFWEDYLIYGNCNSFANRPWGEGQASSLVAKNLKTGKETIIAQADQTNQYGHKKIENNTLYYQQTFVYNPQDWENKNLWQKTVKTFNLENLK